MLPYILLAVAGLIALLLIVVAMKPAEFRISRTATMTAPPEKVFAEVNDFHRWTAWSPWEKIDPDLKRTYEGAATGQGAVYTWSGNNKVGEGRMTIVESRPAERIELKLEFLKPFKAVNKTEFLFQPEGNQTRATWTMTGKKNFMMKLFGLLMNMDKMIGNDFEKGLAAMKATAES